MNEWSKIREKRKWMKMNEVSSYKYSTLPLKQMCMFVFRYMYMFVTWHDPVLILLFCIALSTLLDPYSFIILSPSLVTSSANFILASDFVTIFSSFLSHFTSYDSHLYMWFLLWLILIIFWLMPLFTKLWYMLCIY